MSFLSRIARHFSKPPRLSYGLNELDWKLEKFLEFNRGFFVEAGANDGVTQSNTCYFERNRRWRGILVEPIPHLAEACRRNRQKSCVENVALVPLGFQGKTIQMQYCNLMSVVEGAMKTEEEADAHVARGCSVQGIESHMLTVPVKTLSQILDEHRVKHVDLLSLDVEGFELSALKGLDFSRHRPTHMLIEARYRSEIDDFLRPHYDAVAELSHHDVLYRLRK